VGFAVVPRDLMDAFAGARFLADRHPSTLQQAVVADFLREGFLTSHIRRMRQRYREARDFTVEVLSNCLGRYAELETPECGMQLVTYLREGLSDVAVAEAAQRHGVVVRPVSPMYLAAPPRSGLLLGFTGFGLPSLQIASERLAQAVTRTASGQKAAPALQSAP
jgi:GntR family transcriptional regulator/MocR family aminotransferase